MQSLSGYDKFRNKIRGYRNKVYIGVTTAELTEVDPPKLSVRYAGLDTPYGKFISSVDMSGLEKKDIGKIYIVMFDSDNQTLFVLGEAKYYNGD